MPYYPVFLDLAGQPCLVVGGGTIAEGKVQGLLEALAQVRLIAPTLTPGLQALAAQGAITHVARPYAPGDAAGARLVISATNDPAVNAQVWQDATDRGVLVNVVDDPPHCSFIAPAVVRRGDLTVAISTGGKAPVLAVRLREQLEAQLGEEFARFLSLAGRLRQPMAQRYPAFEQRRQVWYTLVDSDVLALLQAGDETAARLRIAEITGISL